VTFFLYLPQSDADSRRIVQGAAMAHYATLLGDPEANRYLAARKISLDTAHKHLVGVCRGSRLVPYLKGHKLSLRTAADLGLLSPDGREFFTGRLTIAEVTPGGKTLHLTGCAFVQLRRVPANNNRQALCGSPVYPHLWKMIAYFMVLPFDATRESCFMVVSI